MSQARLGLFVFGLACLATACTERMAPTAKAARVEQMQCDHSPSGGGDVAVLQRATVLNAGPLYSHVITGKNGSEDRVTGAKLIVRAPEGVSAERLTRALQCHSAQVLLGQVDASRFADDPYWLPDAWLDIDVKPENGNFVVVVRADNVPDGLHVLHRATAFADTHPTMIDP
jgi:hypothetical protein